MSVTYIYPPVSSDPTTLYQGFVAYMQSQIPGWQPYSGELDDWLGRAFTFIGAQLMEITSDVATSVFRYFGAFILGYPPYDATSALGTVTITVQDTLGYTIPAFTSMSFPDASGQLQGFETTSAVIIASGSSTATVTVQAMTAGASANGCSGAGDLDSSTPITFITALAMAASSSGGTDAEDDISYLNRLASLMTTVTPSPVTVADFTTIVQLQSGVGRALTIGSFSPANWTTTGNTNANRTITGLASTANIPVGAPVSGGTLPAGAFVVSVDSGTQVTASAAPTTPTSGATLTFTGQLNQGGTVTSWVVDPTGQAPTSPVLATIQSAIQAMCLTGVVFNALAPTYTPLTVVANVVAWPSSTLTTSQVQSAVASALTSFLAPLNFGQLGSPPDSNGWLNERVVRLGALQAVCSGVSGVHYVSSVTINGTAADFPLPGVVPLPGTLTLTVNVTTG